MSQHFLVIATEYNVLNLVALAALAQPGDRVSVFADAQSRREGWAQRMVEVAGQRGLQAAQLALHNWTAAEMLRAVRTCVGEDPPAGAPCELVFLAIGGRKHDAIVLHEWVRRVAADSGVALRTVSVDRRPLTLRESHMQAGGIAYRRIPLRQLEPRRRVGLDEVLALHGYRRRGGDYVGPEAPLANPDGREGGERFELAVLRCVQQALRGAEAAPLLNQLWWGVEVQSGSVNVAITEFDVLLLGCDGSVIHFECKLGQAAGMQKKTFQMRRIFTPESRIVLCRGISSTAGDTAVQDTLRSLHAQFQTLGSFDTVLLAQPGGGDRPVSATVPSPVDQIRRILHAAWVQAEAGDGA